MTRPSLFVRARLFLATGLVALVALIVCGLIVVLARYQAAAEQRQAEFVSFVRSARDAARAGDTAKMRRLHLDDEFMNEKALAKAFSEFARVSDEDLLKLLPDYEGDTYCWVRFPGGASVHKLVRSKDGWFIQGDVITLKP